MKITADHEDDVSVVTVYEARIDAAVAVQFKDRMKKITADGDGRVVLDLSHVDFMDSSGLGAIVAAMKDLAPNRRLDLANLQPNVLKVFKLTRMDSVFRIHPSRAAALNATVDAG